MSYFIFKFVFFPCLIYLSYTIHFLQVIQFNLKVFNIDSILLMYISVLTVNAPDWNTHYHVMSHAFRCIYKQEVNASPTRQKKDRFIFNYFQIIRTLNQRARAVTQYLRGLVNNVFCAVFFLRYNTIITRYFASDTFG